MVTLFNVMGLVFIVVSFGSCAMSGGNLATSAGMMQLLIGVLFIIAGAILHELRRRIPLPPGSRPSKLAEFFGA